MPTAIVRLKPRAPALPRFTPTAPTTSRTAPLEQRLNALMEEARKLGFGKQGLRVSPSSDRDGVTIAVYFRSQ